ncbi:MAG TPA: TIM barrel protein [Symbiobacteriaceae bacterium]|nr:TIM barrel protein [Symbiobacteriaceae bacterium]
MNADQVRIGIGPIGWVNDDIRTWGAQTPGSTVMAEMAAAGYVGSEMSYAYPQEPAALRGALAGHGLVLAAAYRWTNLAAPDRFEAEVEATKAHIDFCKAAGARFALVAEGYQSLHWDHRGERSAVTPFTDGQWARLVTGLQLCGEYARAQEMTLAIHPHGGTAIETPAQIDRLFESLDPELVGYCPDTAHITYGGGDPAAVLQRHRERIVYVHLKDVRSAVLAHCRAEGLSFKQAVMQNVFCTPGAGSLDWPAIMAALSGYKGWLIVEAEQDPAVHPAFTVSKRCRAFLRELAGV